MIKKVDSHEKFGESQILKTHTQVGIAHYTTAQPEKEKSGQFEKFVSGKVFSRRPQSNLAPARVYAYKYTGAPTRPRIRLYKRTGVLLQQSRSQKHFTKHDGTRGGSYSCR